LRVLGVYSLPDDEMPLGLRRERHELEKLVNSICQTGGRAVELRVLQYGVTRQLLRETLEEGEGWDVVHFSGHGLAGGLVLERDDGGNQVLDATELAAMLSVARDRLKFVALSACYSAAATEQEVERLLETLNISGHDAAGVSSPAPARTADAHAPSAVAHHFARTLGCPVLGMRYTVGDDFAIGLTLKLYESLFAKGQTLAGALRIALAKATAEGERDAGALAPVTPVLIGESAATLKLVPPSAPLVKPTLDFERPGLAHFPAEPEQFVGRGGTLRRASAAFAWRSRKRAVVFYGMAGAGKSSCALELAYRYRRHRFSHFLWYKAPEESTDASTSLLDLTLQAAKQAPGLDLSAVIGDEETLTSALPLLRQALETTPLLVVLDNVESLLDENGEWRDRRWGLLVRALVEHDGLSRLVLTTRLRPRMFADDDGVAGRVLEEQVYALDLRESVLLASELPGLGRLLRDEAPGLSEGEGPKLVLAVLEIVQGHPELMRLADRLSAAPARLRDHLNSPALARVRASRDLPLTDFFRLGETKVEAREMLDILRRWTRGVVAALAPEARVFFHLLCCMEEDDRLSQIVEDVWRRSVWHGGGVAAAVSFLAMELTRVGLIDLQKDGAEESVFRLHPSVAEVGRLDVDASLAQIVDINMRGYWSQVALTIMEHDGERTGPLLDMMRRIIPYLMRLGQWFAAVSAIEQYLWRDPTPAALDFALPLLRTIAEGTKGRPEYRACAGVLAEALEKQGRSCEAEALQRDVIRDAAEAGDFVVAWSVSSDLGYLLYRRGQFDEALAATEQCAEYARQGGLDRWVEVTCRRVRLQMLLGMGRFDEAAGDQVNELYGEAMNLSPGESRGDVAPFFQLEQVINLTASVALRGGEWRRALKLFTDLARRREGRDAQPVETAQARLGMAQSLVHLNGDEDAYELLIWCKSVFEEHDEWQELASTHNELANLAARAGHWPQARQHAEHALRFHYMVGVPQQVAEGHLSLMSFSALAGGSPAEVASHFAAAGLILLQVGSGVLGRLAVLPGFDKHLPASLDDVCRMVGQVSGVRFRQLFDSLPRLYPTGDEALAKLTELIPVVRVRRRHLAAAALLFKLKSWFGAGAR
jgi:tetratricopeptide (TPR) repeat protein